MTQNGVVHANGVARTGSASDAHAPRDGQARLSRPLPEICYTLRRKLMAFLEQQPSTKLLRDTQHQARVAMGVIEEALRRYGCVRPTPQKRSPRPAS